MEHVEQNWLKNPKAFVLPKYKSTCLIYGMPKSVIESGSADEIVPLYEMADAITRAVYR